MALEDATEALRRHIMDGRFPPGRKLREVTVAETLGVSRTISRLAMSALEHEGLLYREQNRGSRVRSFSIDQVADAVEVRGELEAMAARRAAERGLSPDASAALENLVEQSAALLASGVDDDGTRAEWIVINERFHANLIDASENWALHIAIRQISKLPLVSSSAIIFDRTDSANSRRQLEIAHDDHARILVAVQARHSHRAEALMREHAFRNAQNKRRNLANPDTMAIARDLPGGGLIV